MKNARVAILLVFIMAAGCSTVPNGDISSTSNKYAADNTLNDEFAARNIVYSLSQIPNLRPLQTTIQMTKPATEYGMNVEHYLREAGYGIQFVKSDIGAHYVSYKFEDATTERGPETKYIISIGAVEASRVYKIDGGSLQPDSAMEISGTEESFIELNDSIFEIKGSNYEENVIFVDSIEPETNVIVASNKYENILDEFSIIKKNIHTTEKSNYISVFKDYDDVDSDILVFGNDSLELGVENKNIVQEYAERMNPETDLISVIGCSHGKSGIENGNSILAIGRANRVKEAFVFAGIEYGKILDEGCWAPEYYDEKMPRRGVVLTLKRLKS